MLGKTQEQLTQGQMTYHLRRLKLRGLIERIPKSHRYQVTDVGLRIALFYTCAYNRILQDGMSQAFTEDAPMHNAFRTVQKAFDRCTRTQSAQPKLAA